MAYPRRMDSSKYTTYLKACRVISIDEIKEINKLLTDLLLHGAESFLRN